MKTFQQISRKTITTALLFLAAFAFIAQPVSAEERKDSDPAKEEMARLEQEMLDLASKMPKDSVQRAITTKEIGPSTSDGDPRVHQLKGKLREYRKLKDTRTE